MKLPASISTAKGQSAIKTRGCHERSGFSLIEAVLASAILLLMATFFIGAYLYGQESLIINGRRAQAGLVAEEGLDALRNMRDFDFSSLADGTYGLATTSGYWTLSGTSDTLNSGFTRAITVSTIDANTKQISADVTWQQNQQRSATLSLQTYLSNWRKAGIGDWTLSSIESGYALSVTNNGLRVAVSGNYAYLITNGNILYVFDISDTLNPVLAGQLSLTAYANINNLFVSGDYVYVTSSANAAELIIINISNPPYPWLAVAYDIPGTNDANAVWVSGNYAYVTKTYSATASNSELNIIDISNPWYIPNAPGTLELTDTPVDIAVSGNYAYLASNENTAEFRVVDVSIPTAPLSVRTINITTGTTNTNALSVAVYGNTAYLGRLDSRVYAINITTPTNATLYNAAGFTVSGNPSGEMAIFNDGKYLALTTANATNELNILNVSNPAAISTLETLNIGGATAFVAPGVAYSTSSDRLVLAGSRIASNANRQLVIIKPN